MKPRALSLAAACVAIAVTVPGPARAASRCFVRPPVDVTVAVEEFGPHGTAASCKPGFGFGGAFTVEIRISGIGIVGGQINGPFEPVRCGPAPTACSATTPVFTLFDEEVTCMSRMTIAVRVNLICIPRPV